MKFGDSTAKLALVSNCDNLRFEGQNLKLPDPMEYGHTLWQIEQHQWVNLEIRAPVKNQCFFTLSKMEKTSFKSQSVFVRKSTFIARFDCFPMF